MTAVPQTKRAWKLQEFVAHGGNVNCLAIGQKSGRVMVTGGEDRKVNLWTAGKPNCIMSLAGHTTAVESVRFSNSDEMVVAGSMSGALKIWDLVEAKILRTLTGHKSSVRSLDFHPYGDYTASGSLDSTVKLWDIRRKGCIYTYKGHTNPVNTLRFSPDGKWIATGGEDGLIKIWDLTAGKLLTDLRLHTAGINVIEFHPNEMLLASGSSDKTVKFWDLDTFQLICTTEHDANPVRCIKFDPEGACLYTGVKDFLKVYGWEPTQCYDSVPIAWGEVADIGITSSQLIGASFSKTNVSTFVIDLKRLHPHGGIPHEEGGQQGQPAQQGPPLSSSHGRRSFLTERPPTQSSRQASVPKEDVEEPNSASPDQEDRESVADIRDPKDYQEIFNPRHRLEVFPEPVPVKQPAQPSVRAGRPPTSSRIQQARQKRELPPTAKPSKPVDVPQPKSEPKEAPREVERAPREVDRQPVAQPPVNQRQTSPAGVDPNDFLPTAEQGHQIMSSVLTSRTKNLQTIRVMWTSGNIKTAIDSAISMNDKSVIVDVLNVLNARSHAEVACESCKIILKNFGPLIKANLTAPPSYGVDLSREERYRKCTACYKQLMDIRQVVEKKCTLPGSAGEMFRQLQIMLATLE
ncbi:KTNB1-like protein [Mya arenaria]|uniref:Katanin p80 WD40 repeat-containing subunit B1 n=1 Tax=Mya arenaria TaxID=6604 RepID=A0ABY7EUX5_MYAAR|nr:KTNB1-like protein [Mya arenaria]